MQPGLELDILIATKVMGLVLDKEQAVSAASSSRYAGRPVVVQGKGDYVNLGLDYYCHSVPFYSTEIAAAWTVVEHLMPKDDEFRLTRFEQKEYKCTFSLFFGEDARAKTAPHAICLAALKALETAK